VARIEVYVVTDDDPLAEVGIMYPDIEIVHSKYSSPPPTPPVRDREAALAVAPPAPFELPLLAPVPVRVATVEIRDATNNQLITSIEILSPVNKRGQGLSQYHQKRQSILAANVHLLEIDLLRRGQRPLNQPVIPASAYRIMLTRAPASKVEIWPIALPDLLPVLPIPLRSSDDDVTLDLAQTLQEVYEAGAYDLTVDYTAAPPPPALSAQESLWLEDQLKAVGLRT
jgi:hypothetical protein